MEFMQPGSLAEAIEAKAEYPAAVPIAGGTDVMVEINFDARRPGMLADIALWRIDTLAHDAIAHEIAADRPGGPPVGDPVTALVSGPPAPLELLLVGGTTVVERGELRTTDMTVAAREIRAARRALENGG